MRGAGPIDSARGRDSSASDSAHTVLRSGNELLGADDTGALATVFESPEGLLVRVAATQRSLHPRQEQALDSVVVTMKRDPQRQALIRYTDPANDHGSASWRLAVRAQEYLELEIAPGRVRLVPVRTVDKAGLPKRVDAIEVWVQPSHDR